MFYVACSIFCVAFSIAEGTSCSYLEAETEQFRNGKVVLSNESNVLMSKATYSCDIGYELQGERTRYCHRVDGSWNGTWNGTAPTCVFNNAPEVILDCDNLPEADVSGTITWPSLEDFSEDKRRVITHNARLSMEVACFGAKSKLIQRYYASMERSTSNPIALRPVLKRLDVNLRIPLMVPTGTPNVCSAVFAVQYPRSNKLYFVSCSWKTDSKFPVAHSQEHQQARAPEDSA